MDLLHLLEPEESIGKLWHRAVGRGSTTPHFPDEAVKFEDVVGRLRIFFRGLGGDAGVELKSAVPEVSHHRLTRRLRLGKRAERLGRARFNGERLSLPDSIDFFPHKAQNEALYFWLAAWSVAAGHSRPTASGDAMRNDLSRIEDAARATATVLKAFPGLVRTYESLRAATLALRPERRLPPAEAYVETEILRQLSVSYLDNGCDRDMCTASLTPPNDETPAGYRSFFPVPLWGEVESWSASTSTGSREEDPGGGRTPSGDQKSRRARRRASDQVERKAGFFVHRFEKVLTWTEFMNLHRDVEDDEEESARKAADDHDEIGIGNLKKKSATRLAIDLDLAPSDVDIERLSDAHTYPEWDFRRQALLPDQVRILELSGDQAPVSLDWEPSPKVTRRIRSVRRQFEALRPKREILNRQFDGHDLDMDEFIRSHTDIKAEGQGSDRIYRQARDQARDLSVAVLIDTSRSTESFVEDRPVIDIAREALVALSEGLDACGDRSAIFSFSSIRRTRVFVTRLKDFDEPSSRQVRARIAALRSGFYTRLGAAIRHVSAALAEQPSRKRLLLVLTDGKPNDLDHYEGRYGIEDTRKAILEARRIGQAVFGITIDSKAQSYFPHIFGAGGFAILNRPSRLTAALPKLYRHLVA